MEILRFVGCISLKLIIFLMVTMLPEIAHGNFIFDIILGNQHQMCSSLIEPQNHSIVDQGVVHPPPISERINFEYTITTPNFPLNYPTNIQCISLIKAPSFDYHIVLEVRKKFDVEPSKNCLRDFLEITDGPYGFSKRIGKFCNSEKPPKEVKSTGPFLWLRFRSDNDLPHNGFEIAYRFTRNTNTAVQRNYCYKQTMIEPGHSFNFNTSFIVAKLKEFAKIQDNNSIPLECVFDFYVNPDFRTYAYTSHFSKPNFPNPCSSTNKMAIYNKNTFDADVRNQQHLNYYPICEENDFPKRLFKQSTRTTIRVITDDLNKMNNIVIILTSVKIVKEKCPPHYFLCSTKPLLCISIKLTCNGEPNCPESNDENCFNGIILPPGVEKNTTAIPDPIVSKKMKAKEDDDKNQKKTNKVHAIILGSIASVLVLSMVFCLLLTIHSKKKDKDMRQVNVLDVHGSNQDKPQNKSMFYELLQSSEQSVVALSTDKLSRKIYNDNQIWSKRPLNDTSSSSAPRNNNSNFKLNGGIKTDAIRYTTIHPFKLKLDSTKSSSLNKIGKYLSVPNPAKNETTIKPIIPNKSCNQNQLFNITSPSDDFQSWSSNSFSKQNSLANRSTHHIQRASSMGSGLRRQLQEPVDGDELSKNIEWYCGPVIRDNNIRNNSSEMLNAYPAKSSQHVPGCRSLPNFCNVGLQNPVYYTKPIPNDTSHTVTDLLDCSADDNSSYREDTPTFSIQNHSQKYTMNKYPEFNRNNDGASSHYGFKYFCAHDPISRNDFVEYIA